MTDEPDAPINGPSAGGSAGDAETTDAGTTDAGAAEAGIVAGALALWGLAGAVATPLPLNQQGLSDARVWRVRRGNEVFALRRLSGQLAEAQRTTQTHRLMRYAARVLDFVPWPRSIDSGETVALHDGAFWTLESWMPGEAAEELTRPMVEVAATALWMFHEVTHDSQCFGAVEELGPCDAMKRRLSVLGAFSPDAPSAVAGSDDATRQQCDRLRRLLPQAIAQTQPIVTRAVEQQGRRQPIIGDVRRGHLLFSGMRVTGLVDYGAATVDSPLVDLTRMLGELAGNDVDRWAAGLAAYQMHRRLDEGEQQLVAALDAGGVVGASIRWLSWLANGTAPASLPVAARLGELADRLEPLAGGILVASRALARKAT